MERRLLRRIVNPAAIAVWVFGILLVLASPPGLIAAGWLHAKLALVVALTVLHHFFARWRKDFERGTNRHSSRFYRIFNEVPALLRRPHRHLGGGEAVLRAIGLGRRPVEDASGRGPSAPVTQN